jgi:preprotein translocase subunit SecG
MISFFIMSLTAILAIICLLMVLIILMQRPKQEGLGAAFGGGVTDQMFGAQTSNVLQKVTVTLAIIFFVITLILAVLVGKQQEHNKTLLNPQVSGSESTGTDPGGQNGATTPSIIDLGNQDNKKEDTKPEEKTAPIPIEENKTPQTQPAPEPVEENKSPTEEPAPEPIEENKSPTKEPAPEPVEENKSPTEEPAPEPKKESKEQSDADPSENTKPAEEPTKESP